MEEENAAEWRDVQVETELGTFICYMTNSPDLCAMEFERRGYVMSETSLLQFRLELLSPNPIKEKMKELGANRTILRLTSDGRETYCVIREDDDFCSIPAKFLVDWEKHSFVSKRDIDFLFDLIYSCLSSEELSNDKDIQNRILQIHQLLEDGIEKQDKFIMKLISKFRGNSRDHAMLMLQKTYLLNMFRFANSFHLKSSHKYSKFLDEQDGNNVFEGFSINAEDSFSELLDNYRREKGMDEVELYRKACLSRQEYNKIKSGKSLPGRKTVAALMFALGLNTDEAESLLASAGQSFRQTDVFSKLIRQFLVQKKSFDEVNEELFKVGLDLETGHYE